jgi:hypothetical protein
MNLFKTLSKRPRIFIYLLLIAIAIAVVLGLAQPQNGKSGRVLVDGRLNPEKVPDWILWNEIFVIATHLNEKSSTQGRELWIDRLHLPENAMKEIIEIGYEQLEMSDDASNEAEDFIADSKKDKPDKIDHPNREEGLRIKLKKVQLHRESRTLEIRDKLRQRIGDDAYLRLSSFARLQIAPNIKIGN